MTEETTTAEKPKRTTRTATAKGSAPAIYGAIHKVMEGMASIPKNGVMSFGKTNYTYLKADDVQERLNPLLVEHGIIVKADYTVENVDRGRGEGAPTVPYVYVQLLLTYIAVEDGSELQVSGFGEAQAADDKSINKALTQAIKNVHRTTFQFASGEPEPDDYAPGQNAAPQQTSAAQAKIDQARPSAAPQQAAGSTQAQALDSLRNAIKAAAGQKGMNADQLNALGAEIGGAGGDWFNDGNVLNQMLARIQG